MRIYLLYGSRSKAEFKHKPNRALSSRNLKPKESRHKCRKTLITQELDNIALHNRNAGLCQRQHVLQVLKAGFCGPGLEKPPRRQITLKWALKGGVGGAGDSSSKEIT